MIDEIQAIQGKCGQLVIEVMSGPDKGMKIKAENKDLWMLHEIYPDDTIIKLYFEP